jgi:hypothetical protein
VRQSITTVADFVVACGAHGTTQSDVAARLNLATRTAQNTLGMARQAGLIVRVGCRGGDIKMQNRWYGVGLAPAGVGAVGVTDGPLRKTKAKAQPSASAPKGPAKRTIYKPEDSQWAPKKQLEPMPETFVGKGIGRYIAPPASAAARGVDR